jgi:transcriptional regulator with XRE-family HTH domain
MHPFRSAREALGAAEGSTLTQTQFAKRLGVSASYIQRIELGQVPPPDDLCRKVGLMTGASLESLKKKRGAALDSSRKPITPDSVRKVGTIRTDDYYRAVGFYALKHALLSLESIGFAAASAQRNRLDVLLISFQGWLESALAEFGLKVGFDRELKERSAKWNAAMWTRKNPLFAWPNPTTESLTAGLFAAQKTYDMIAEDVQAGKNLDHWIAFGKADIEKAFDPTDQAEPARKATTLP